MHALLSIDTSLRRAACDGLIASGTSPFAAEVIGSFARQSDIPEFVREIACAVLGYLGEPSGIPALAALAVPPNPTAMRFSALMAIAEMVADPDSTAHFSLVGAEYDRIGKIRQAAAYGLAAEASRDRVLYADAVEALTDAAKRDRRVPSRELTTWALEVAASGGTIVNPRRLKSG